MRSRTLPSSISSRPPGLAASKISGWGSGTRLAVPGARIEVEAQLLALFSSIGPLAKAPSRSFGPCRSIRMAIGMLVLLLERAQLLDALAMVVVRAVAEVEAEDVGAGLEQRAQALGAGGGRAQGGDDLGETLRDACGAVYFFGDDTLKSPACS